MLVAPNDHTDWPSRVELLLQLVESEADSRLANGTPGAWGDVTRRCRAAGEAMRAETACDARWHTYWLELSLWGEVFHTFMLPERQDHLLAALKAAANLATPEDPEAWDALLLLVHPGLGDPAAAVHPNTFIQIEVRFYRTLRAFRVDPSVSSLRACLAIVLEILRVVERQTSHRPCGPAAYLAGNVVSEALTGLLPLAHRWALTRAVEVLFFRLYGEGEEAGSGHVPLALWRQLSKGQVVAPVILRLLDPSRDTGPSDGGPWFVEEIEGLVTPYSEWSWEDLLLPWRRPAKPRDREEAKGRAESSDGGPAARRRPSGIDGSSPDP